MRLLRGLLFVILLVAPALQAGAPAPARHALLIGNQSYTREVGTLKNPHNDVALIAAALEKIGFKRENIRRVTDADRITILREVDAYSERLAAASADAIGFFYYSGHGVANERDQRNYLIPIEVKQLDSSVWFSGVPLDEIISKLSAQARDASHFVLFDACRNVLNVPTRGSKGFVPIASRRGMLIGFSTEPGQTASDAGVTGGPYAVALAAELVKPGQGHPDMFQNVREEVFRTTRAQVPWEQSGLVSRIHLGGMAVTAKETGPFVYSPGSGHVSSVDPGSVASANPEHQKVISDFEEKLAKAEQELKRQAALNAVVELRRREAEERASSERAKLEAEQRSRRLSIENEARARAIAEEAENSRREAERREAAVRAVAEEQERERVRLEAEKRREEENQLKLRFGAIAKGENSRALGWSFDATTREEAEASALQNCPANCRIVTWFQNSCAAIAFGSGTTWGSAWAKDKHEASKSALAKCQNFGSNCYVARWVCTSK